MLNIKKNEILKQIQNIDTEIFRLEKEYDKDENKQSN